MQLSGALQVLQAYLEQFFCDEAVGLAGTASRPLPGTRNLLLPYSANAADFVAIVNALPDSDSPALFGLPANINRTAGRSNTAAVVASLKQITASKVSAYWNVRSVCLPVSGHHLLWSIAPDV